MATLLTGLANGVGVWALGEFGATVCLVSLWPFTLISRMPWQWRLAAVVAAPLVLINGAVTVLGETAVFPLSPFFLEQKAQAIWAYVSHRPGCLLRGHHDVEALAREAEIRHKLPRGLMRAVVQVESNGRAHRISPAGAMGPAQLMPGTARMLRVDDPFEPDEAIDGGARYLRKLLSRFDGNVSLAVAAYNAGPGAVRGAVPKNGETEVYVAKVMRALNAKSGRRGISPLR